MNPFFTTYNPDLSGLAQADTINDATAEIQTPPDGGSAARKIVEDMAKDPAMAMANIALARRDEGTLEDVQDIYPVLQVLGYELADLEPHLPRARALFAQAVAASEKVLDHARAS